MILLVATLLSAIPYNLAHLTGKYIGLNHAEALLRSFILKSQLHALRQKKTTCLHVTKKSDTHYLEILSQDQVVFKQKWLTGVQLTWHSNLGYPRLCFDVRGLSRGQFGYFKLMAGHMVREVPVRLPGFLM